jgi:hypothetical protein
MRAKTIRLQPVCRSLAIEMEQHLGNLSFGFQKHEASILGSQGLP